MKISNDELEIFSRQIIMNDFNDVSFTKLQKNKVSIIGMGGIGCPLSQYLVSCGIKNMNIFDDDVIQKHNLNRQILFNINDIGKSKTKIASKKLLNINPYLQINSFSNKIDKNNLYLLKESSIIIDTSDNWNTMRLVNAYALDNNIPLISSSVASYDIQIILFENKKDNHLCLECIFPNKKEPKLARCDTVGVLGTAAGLAGIITAQKTINFLMQFEKNNNILTLFDCKTLSLSNIKVSGNIKCRLK